VYILNGRFCGKIFFRLAVTVTHYPTPAKSLWLDAVLTWRFLVSESTPSTPEQLADYRQTAIDAARTAGDVLQEWSRKFTVSEKGRADLVTEADVNAQEAIFQAINGKFPDHSFLGEEGLAVENDGSPFRWIIDPLDGTTNYVHGFPYYCVSIALEENGELVVGVIFDPNRDEVFTATKGGGAFMNGEPIQCSQIEDISDAMCVASLPVGTNGTERQVKQFLHVLPQSRTVQRTGSAALNLSYVACGRLDVYWSGTLKPWDQAAGALIVTEAGGSTTKMDGSAFEVDQPDLLSSNGRTVHGQIQKLLNEVD
jgi:myo-inositol-1(or 4)-monophosphatase